MYVYLSPHQRHKSVFALQLYCYGRSVPVCQAKATKGYEGVGSSDEEDDVCEKEQDGTKDDV